MARKFPSPISPLSTDFLITILSPQCSADTSTTRPASMATSTETPTFQHNPLQDAKTHIRLLKIVSVVKTRAIPVHCELATFPIAEAPPYRAISYTWGDPAHLTSIIVNGQQMNVRLNCEYALRQASQEDEDGTADHLIWIDSICVNQLDNDEKGAQVAMMGEIFKTASRVLACVGAHGDDSKFLYEFLHGQEKRFRSLLLSEEYSSSDGTIFYNSKLIGREAATWRWKHSRSTLLRMCKAVASFLARPYFHRVWIYQELFLGRDMSVYCDDQTLPISWLWVTSSMIQCWWLRSTNYGLFVRTSMWNTVWSNIEEAIPLLLAGAKEQSLIPFIEATAHVASLLCENPRDSVYGILSITRPVEGHNFQPDYTKDRMDLAVEVLHRARTEIIDRDYAHPDLADYAKSVGLNVKLKERPSRKLVAAMELRRSSISLPGMMPTLADSRDETILKATMRFVGCRILFKEGRWDFESQDQWFQKHGLKSGAPRIEKWVQSDPIPSSPVGISLPPEAQDGDWLLISRSSHWTGKVYSRWNRFAFLARYHDSEKFDIVSKVLISTWISKWDNIFKNGASKFRVHCDPEDLLVLFHLCEWRELWCIKKWEDSKSFNAYFQTRFCGERFSSYAVRTEY